MKNSLRKSLLVGASTLLACLSLGTRSARAVNFYFDSELFGETFRGIFAGEDGAINPGQIDAPEATAFEVTWRDLTWTLDGLTGLRVYHQPGDTEGLLDWMVAETEDASGEMVNLTYASLQQGVMQVRIGSVDGNGELLNRWIWTNGLPIGVGDPPWLAGNSTPGSGSTNGDTGNPPTSPTSVPEPSLLAGLAALGLGGWLRRKEQPKSS